MLKDKIVWSYTKLTKYETCPHAYYRHYIQKAEGRDNAYAQWGSLMHKILELNNKGKLPAERMITEYEKRFDSVITEDFIDFRAGQNTREEYYKAGIGFLFNYGGVPEEYEVVACESKVDTIIGGCKFTGRLDLLLKAKNDEGLMLVDYKSKSRFHSQREENEQLRQLYLYSKYVQEKYGQVPSQLAFYLIRSNDMHTHQYNPNAYQAAVDWATDIIDRATKDIYFEYELDRRRGRGLYSTPSFCNMICEYRDDCEAKI